MPPSYMGAPLLSRIVKAVARGVSQEELATEAWQSLVDETLRIVRVGGRSVKSRSEARPAGL